MRPLAYLTVTLTASLMLAGCVTTSGGDFCRVAKPIYLDTLDGKTTAEKRAILEHNSKGEALCKWGPA